jgi:uncharacterized protein
MPVQRCGAPVRRRTRPDRAASGAGSKPDIDRHRREGGATVGIQVRDVPDEQRYEITIDGRTAGVASYELDGARLCFTHTEVDDDHSGQGVGSQLVTEALEDVSRRGLQVVPQCPYVRKIIAEEGNHYLQLVPPEVREEFGLAAG